MDFFVYNSADGTLDINEYQMFLIKEFGELLDIERNKCNEDKTGKLKLRARRELAYIWLKMDPKSPYDQYTEREAHEAALNDSQLTEEQFNDELFRAACRKYQELLDSDLSLQLIRSAKNTLIKLKYYFDNEVDFSERTANNTPVYKAKDVINEIKTIGDAMAGLRDLEVMYKKGQDSAGKSARGDVEKGLLDELRS